MMTCQLLGSVVGGHGLYRCLCYDDLPPTVQCCEGHGLYRCLCYDDLPPTGQCSGGHGL